MQCFHCLLQLQSLKFVCLFAYPLYGSSNCGSVKISSNFCKFNFLYFSVFDVRLQCNVLIVYYNISLVDSFVCSHIHCMVRQNVVSVKSKFRFSLFHFFMDIVQI